MHYLKLSTIILQLLAIHETGKVQVHICFSGHVEGIRVEVYIPKWETRRIPDLIFEGYLDKNNSFEKFEKEVNNFIKEFNFSNE